MSAALLPLIGVLLLMTGPLNAQTITADKTGMHNGYFYTFWNDRRSGAAAMTLQAAGKYETRWTDIGNFTAGKGWAAGKADRVISFSGSFNGGKNGYLAVYGWTRNALIEYYIVENYGSWKPPGGVSKGTLVSDGGVYHIYETIRTNQPSVEGIKTFRQYWSVRTVKRSKGRVTFANHVTAWKKKNMHLGTTWGYQILVTEGSSSSGHSVVTVEETNKAGAG